MIKTKISKRHTSTLFSALALAFLLVCRPGVVWAQDECAKPRTETQKTICTTPALQQLDLEFEAAYSRAAEKLLGERRWQEHLHHTNWRLMRDKCGPYAKCIEKEYRKEIDRLKGIGTANSDDAQAADQAKVAPMKAPSWCSRAKLPVEIAICSSNSLSEKDRRLEQLYVARLKDAEGSRDSDWLKSAQREWLSQRNDCGTSVACLESTYRVRLSELEQPTKAEKVYYGSRAGMQATIVSKSGTGSANSRIEVKITPEDAKIYCAEYGQDFSESCVEETLKTDIADHVSADCINGTWTDLHSQSHKQADVEALDDSMASGKANLLELFRMLCPTT